MKRILAIFILSAISSYGYGQHENEDPIAQHLFPPEIVMKYEYDIGLDETQHTTITTEIEKARAKFLDLKQQLQAETQNMAQLLQAASVDEALVLAQVDKVMDLKREVKKTHLSLLIRIKSTLTQKQQTRLIEIRKSSK